MSLVSGLSDFAWNLVKVAGPETENVFLSPISISIALAMTYAGADGNTAAELEKAMFPGLKGKDVHESFKSLIPLLTSTEKSLALHSANRIYAKKNFQLLEEFTGTLSKFYGSEMKTVDFDEATRLEINAWVEEVTKTKIKNLIPSGIFDDLTRLVLVNAIYFKGNWEKQFDSEATLKKPFFSSLDSQKDVEMMRKKEKFLFGETDSVKVLGLPYVSGENKLTFFAFLPKTKCGLAEVEAKMGGQIMLDLVRKVRKQDVFVQLPKFKLEQSLSLKTALSKLGMAEMFNLDKADFSKITGSRDLFVSAVLHKAFIDVNEEGSEAAAATALLMNIRCAVRHEEPKEFIADHPFLFGIFSQSEKSEIIPLFLGRYAGN